MQTFDSWAVRVLTWSGLRGAISVAMALSLPSQAAGADVPKREVILVITYVVVVFSVLAPANGRAKRCRHVPSRCSPPRGDEPGCLPTPRLVMRACSSSAPAQRRRAMPSPVVGT